MPPATLPNQRGASHDLVFLDFSWRFAEVSAESTTEATVESSLEASVDVDASAILALFMKSPYQNNSG